jgi:hypothetical protein
MSIERIAMPIKNIMMLVSAIVAEAALRWW